MNVIKLGFLLLFIQFQLLLGGSAVAGLSENKLSPLLKERMHLEAEEKISVLVYLTKEAKFDLQLLNSLKNREEKGRYVLNTLQSVANSSQRSLTHYLEESKIHFERYYISNMIVLFDVTTSQIESISKRSDVRKMTLNKSSKMRPNTSFSVTSDLLPEESKGIGSNITSIGADRVWNEFKIKGEGIVVAGQDTGVDYLHPALKKSYRGLLASGQYDHRYSWHDSIKSSINSDQSKCGYNTKTPCDDDQHGTHTMGTMVGDDGQGNQIGVAPKANWIACRNMDGGVGRPSTYIECFEWFLAPYPQGSNKFTTSRSEFSPHVINNSWGCPADEGCHEAEILPVLEALKAAGIMVIASAGNDGPNCSTITDPPAMHTKATLSVGAHNHSDGSLASFSSRGPSIFDHGLAPHVTAPGVSIRSSVPGGSYSGSFWSGTSMAGPHVVGEVALIWSANKKLIGQIENTADLIKKSATPKTISESCGSIPGNVIPNNSFGFGMINAFKAVKMALSN